MTSVNMKKFENAEITCAKHEYEYSILKKKKNSEIRGYSENSHP